MKRERSLPSALWRVALAPRYEGFAFYRADPDRVRAVVEMFSGDDDAMLLAMESAITGGDAWPLAVMSEWMYELRAAPCPMRVDLRALRRCCEIAWAARTGQLFDGLMN